MVFNEELALHDSYFREGEALSFPEGVGDYVALAGKLLTPSGYLEGVKDFINPHPSHEFIWGIGELVQALIDAGLTLTTLREYPYTNGARPFLNMRELPGGRTTTPEQVPSLPLMYSVAARKP
jgi:hypothetical protein